MPRVMIGVSMSVLNARLLAGVASLALSAFALPGVASAASVYGASGIFTNRPCPPEATSCVGQRNFVQYHGGMSTEFSASATNIPGGASTAAAVSFGDGYLPQIKAASTAGAETRTGSSIVAFRSFTYEGDAAIDLAFEGVLHYFTSGDQEGGEIAGDGLLNAKLTVLPLSAIAHYSPSTDAFTLIGDTSMYEADCGSGALASASANSNGQSAGEYNVTLGITQGCDGNALTMQKGDSFVLMVLMQSISNRGGFINAMNTFTVKYDVENTVYTGTTEKVGLATLQQTVSGAVPEPGTWALMIGGFGLAGAALRRRRAALAN